MWMSSCWLSLAAHAGPLDLPEPADMGKYRCEERPLGMENPAPLGDRTVGTMPPGAPTYPQGLQSGLLPFAPDALLKKAGKGTGMYPAPAVASLATQGSVVGRSCQNRANTVDDFSVGCKVAYACQVLTKVEGASATFDRRPQVAARFSPVDSAKEALGLVWFLDPLLFLPLTPEELAAWSTEAANYHAVVPDIPWVEVEEHEGGWLVRAPRKLVCGCSHDLVRRAYWVSRDGRSCAVAETPMPLAVAASEICVD